MYSTANSNRMMGLAITTAMAGALLTGCTTTAAPRADLSASRAEAALARGQEKPAIVHAEAAVLAEPQNAAYRVTLGNAYLQAGRFGSAAATFSDAMALGDTQPRTALTLALSLMGQGKLVEAGALLNKWEDKIAPADLGLALALSGQADRGIMIMSNAIRGGQNNVKIRQNLAYAYALAGRWREARLMAAQDVPADKVGDRMEQWAQSAQPDAWQTRIAGLLDVPAGIQDAGQPTRLALVNNPSLEQMAAQATASVAAPQPAGELPALAVADAAPVSIPAPALQVPTSNTPAQIAEVAVPASVAAPPAPATFETAVAAPAMANSSLAALTPDTARFAQAEVAKPRAVQDTPRRTARPSSATADGTHLIQLGSFASEAGARRAWNIYTKKYPELSGHELVLSEAMVRGKHYWRVSAAGYSRSSSSSMCGRVQSGGQGCFAYAEGRPLPGAIDRGIRLASR